MSDVFGRYRIIRRLAVGGMGEVFLARQLGVAERLVILKSLLPDLAADKSAVQGFLDEARVAAMLNHPNIVSIHEVGLHEETYFIAMEYIEGENLARLLRAANGALPVDVAVLVAHDAAVALDHAHRAVDLAGKPLHIVHRDVSPQNIMLRSDGVTKVVDFGIAKAANRAQQTATGILKGKVHYMSPEQVDGGVEVDGRTDQFALGAVLWELVAGTKLFEGKSDVEVIRRVALCEVPRLSSVAPSIAPELDAIVARMLAADRDARYLTLADAAHELVRLLPAGTATAQATAAGLVERLVGDAVRARTKDVGPAGAPTIVDVNGPSRVTAVSQQSTLQLHHARTSTRRVAVIAALAATCVTAIVIAAVFFAFRPPPRVVELRPPMMPPPPYEAMADDAAGVIPETCTTHQFRGNYCDDDDDPDAEARHDALKDQLGIDLGCGEKAGSPAFCPAARITRGEAVYALMAAANIPLDGHRDAFDDDNGDPHEKYLDAAAAFGLLVTSDRRVHPNERITRDEIAGILCRMYRLPDGDRDYFFDDDGAPEESCHNALATVHVMTGRLLPGRPRREFRGDAPESRSRIATVVVKARDANLTATWVK